MVTKNCLAGVCSPQRTEGSVDNASQGEWLLASVKGPGIFLAAQVSQQGSKTSTVVHLDIDGRSVVSISYADAAAYGFTQQNPYGIVLLVGSKQNLTIGLPSPLRFQKRLALYVEVKEDGAGQIQSNVIHGV